MNQVFLHSLAPAFLGALAGLFTVNAVEILSPQRAIVQETAVPARASIVNGRLESGRGQGAHSAVISLRSR